MVFHLFVSSYCGRDCKCQYLIELIGGLGEMMRNQFVISEIVPTSTQYPHDLKLIPSMYQHDPIKTGGKIGWIYLENVMTEIAEFKDILPNLKVGQISEPFNTKYGYHIVRLDNKTEKHKMTLETDRETIARIAKTKKGDEEFNKFLEKSKKEVYIEIKDPI